MDYNAVQNQILPDAGAAILGGIEKGQTIRKGILDSYLAQKGIEKQGKVEDLQQQYLGATDEKQKQALLGQIAVYNPEHAKGIAAISNMSNPFEGNSIEAQKANLQYQRYKAIGIPDGEARIKAINDAASTSAQYYTDAGGNRVTIGGMPLPDVKPMLGGNAPTQPAPGGLPAYGTGDKPSQADKIVNSLPIQENLASATPEEKSFVNEVMSSPNPAKVYNSKVQEHPELAAAHPQWDDTVAGHFNEINTAFNKNPYANSPKVQVSAAEAQAKKDVDMSGIQPSTAAQLEKDMVLASNVRSQVSDIKSLMKPEYQTFKWQGGMAWNALKDKVDVKSLSPEDRKGLEDFTTYRASAGQLFSNVLKDLSGAAVNPSEFKRAEAYLPNAGSGVFDGDSPTQLQSKINRLEDFQDKALARLFYVRKNGMAIDKVDLDSMPKIMNQRGNQVEKELTATGLKGNELKAAVKDALSKEFGLVR